MLSFLDKKISTPLIALTLPLVLTNLVQSALPFFETIFLSSLSQASLAAGALVAWLFGTVIVIIFGTFSAINVLVAHQFGAKKFHNIPHILRDGILVALLFTIPTFILCWYAAKILIVFGQTEQLAQLAQLYLHALAWGLLPKFVLIILYEFIIGLGHARVIMYATICSIPLYIFLSYVLIFGKFGFPMLGIAGAGWGMTYADWFMACLFIILLFASKTYRPYFTAIFNFNKPSYLAEILSIGLPMGLMFCFEVAFFFGMALIMGSLGVKTLAANQVVMQYLGIFVGIIFCIAQAITVQMGQFIGAKQIIEAEKTAYAGIFIAFTLMLIVALMFCLIPKLLIAVDFKINDPNNLEIINIATQFFIVAGVFQILEAIRLSLFGALRALKDTRFMLISSIISFWFIALLFSYILIKYVMVSSVWVWWLMCIGAAFNAALLYYRFNKKMYGLKHAHTQLKTV